MSRYEYYNPVKLKAGDTVGVVAPASPFDRERFEQGVDVIRGMDLKVVVPEEVYLEDRFLAGPDRLRADGLHRMFMEPDVKAIVCARGGYGGLRLLSLLDYRKIGNHPKLFLGFSDITALLTTISQRCRLITYHGPVMTSLADAGHDTIASLEDILFSDSLPVFQGDTGCVVFPGRAEGVVVGGNLSTLCHLTGTPFFPDLNGAILCLEDVGEAPYKIDRMLSQMKLAGVFDGLVGVVGGSFDQCGDPDVIVDSVRDVFGDLSIPVFMGFPFGHSEPNLTFPIGGWATMDSDLMRLEFQ